MKCSDLSAPADYSRSRSRTTVGTAVAIGLSLLAAYNVVSAIATFLNGAPMRDFFAFYESARGWWQVGVLYEPRQFVNLNPPHVSVVLFTPLLALEPAAAAVLWFAVSAGLIAVSVAMIQAEVALSRRQTWILIAVLLASSAMHHQLRQGQLGAVLLFVGTITWRATRRRAGAGWLALLISIKPWMACWLPLVSRRAAARTIAYGVAGISIGIALLGIENWFAWIDTLRAEPVRLWPSNVGVLPALTRLGDHGVASAAWIATLAVIVFVCWRSRASDIDRRWLVFGLGGLLVSPIAWTYYLLAMIGPLVAWGQRADWPPTVRASVALLLIPAPAVGWIDMQFPAAPSLSSIAVAALWMVASSERTGMRRRLAEFPNHGHGVAAVATGR